MTQAISKRVRSGALANYDPGKGLQAIAVAEVAERHYARAKDAAGLQQAIRVKLTAQCEFVRWWDQQDKQQGTRGVGKRVAFQIGNATLVAGQGGLPDRITIHRWRQRLNPKKFDATERKTFARAVKIVEFQQTTGSVAGVNMPESNEWYTPPRYIEAARTVLGAIDLDPASSEIANATVKAAQFFTRDEDGLTQPWHGRVWMNPPYSGQAAAFIERLVQSLQTGNVVAAVVLVNSHGTDTQWFQPLWDGLVCFTDHRINFISPQEGAEESGSNHGSVFVYFGPRRDLFLQAFTPLRGGR